MILNGWHHSNGDKYRMGALFLFVFNIKFIGVASGLLAAKKFQYDDMTQ